MSDPSTKVIRAKAPDEVRFIAILDPHLAATAPESWKADYKQVLEAALEQVFLFGVKNKVDATIWAGDLFHRKAASRNPLAFIEDCMRLLRKTENPNVGVAGNHVVKYGSLDGLTGQPLSLLIEAGSYQLLDREELLVVTESGFSVRVAGASFEHGRAEGCRDKQKKGANVLVSVGHFWFGKEDGVFNGEPLFSPKFLEPGESDVYVIGHKHDDQGIFREGKTLYVVPGAITLLGEHANDSTRRPAAAYLCIKPMSTEFHILRPKMPMIQDLLNMEKREQLLQENQELEAFVNNISQANVGSLDPADVLISMDMQDDVRKKVDYYLDQARGA